MSTPKELAKASEFQRAASCWMDAFEVETTTADAWRGAMDLCVTHQLSSWDALVLNVAAQSGARLLLTEDMHPGLCWRGMRVVNPYSQEPDPRLAQLLT